MEEMGVVFVLFDGALEVPVGCYTSVERAKAAARQIPQDIPDWCVVRFPVDCAPDSHLNVVYTCIDGRGAYT